MKYIITFIVSLILVSCSLQEDPLPEMNYPIQNTGAKDTQIKEEAGVSEKEMRETLSDEDILSILEEIERLAQENSPKY